MDIHTLLSSTMRVLSRSHKRDLVVLLKEKANVEEQLAAEQAQLAQAQQELARVQQELLNRDTLIAGLRKENSTNNTQV